MLRWRHDAEEEPEVRTKTPRHRRRSRKHKDKEEVDYIDVDVGTSTPVRVFATTGTACSLIHKSSRSVLYRATSIDRPDEVIVVRWCRAKFSSLDKDDVATDLVSKYVPVPVYRIKQKFMHQGMHVSIGVRSYIPGTPLSEVLHKSPDKMIDHYMAQVEHICKSMQQVQSDKFGSILDGEFMCGSPTKHLATKMMLERLSGNSYITDDMHERLSDVRYDTQPVFCHGKLWPEHIIVNGTSVDGIVGWSDADFTIEHVDRILYLMCDEKEEKYKKWRDFLAALPTNLHQADVPCNTRECITQYCKAVSMDRTAGKHAKYISGVFHELSPDTGLVPAPLTARGSTAESDKTSLHAPTELTTDTWENFTVTTLEK